MKNNTPKYIALFNSLKDKINSGEYKANTRLPSKRDLAISLNLSINTVINAYSLLLDEGYIYSIEKKGYFVSDILMLTTKSSNSNIEKKEEVKEYKYDFTTSNVEGFIDTSWKRILKDNLKNEEYLFKSEPMGSISLREEIRKHLSLNRGINTKASNILIASGMEVMDYILRLINIDNISMENPGYHKLKTIANNTNKRISYCELDREGVIPPSLQTILYTTPFNQFPTGIKMSIKRKKEIISFLNETDSYLIEDDFDAEFRINSSPTTALYSLDSNRVIFFSTFSTTMYPGLRIAYLILPDKILELYKKSYLSYNTPSSRLIQESLKDFIRDGYYASWINKRKRLYIKKRECAMRVLDSLNIKYNKKANYLSLLIDCGKDISDELMEKLRLHGINIECLRSYDVYNRKSPYLILGYTGIDINDIEKGIKELKDCLD